MLARLMVDGEKTPDWFKNEPPTRFEDALGVVDESSGHRIAILTKDNPELSDKEYEKLRERWFAFDPRLKVVITQPMAYIPMGGPPVILDDLKPEDNPNHDKFMNYFTSGGRVTGIINRDPGDETKAREQCPSTIEIADSVSSGWSGPLGDEVRCELAEGHEGDHQCTVTWDDLMATHNG
jgi:hypothetical protein